MIVEFNANATPASAQAVVRGLAFHNVSESPSSTPRTLRLVLTDGDGGISAPATKTILVRPVNIPPIVSFSTPENKTVFNALNDIRLSANSEDVDGNVVVIKFIAGSTVIGQSTTRPFAFNWENVPIGLYVLSAQATDNEGAVTVSSTINISVNPAINELNLTESSTVELTIVGIPGVTYEVQASEDLKFWATIATLQGTGENIPFVDETILTSVGQRFYRIVQLP